MSCGYKLGRLKNFVYLVENLKYNVTDYKVYITAGTVYKLYTDLTILNETESYADRFKFTTTVTCTLNRIIDDSLFRQHNFKIIVEDQKGMQFLVSPEFNARFTSELTIGESISNVLTFTTQSNIPTRILQNKIKSIAQIEAPCKYSGLGVQKLFIGRNSQYKEVDFISVEYTKIFNGQYDSVQLVFSYPIEDNDWHYELISFPDNRWDMKLVTPDDTVLANSLFPQYTRQTQEETLDRFTITMRGVEGSTLIGDSGQTAQYRWVPIEGEFICDGFDKYVKESKEQLIDGEWVELQEYRKGVLIQRNSEDCGYVVQVYYRWVTLDVQYHYECVGFNKHYQQKQQKSEDDGLTWTDTGVTRAGDIVQVDSPDCGYVLTEWREVEGEYICEEYDPTATWVLLPDEFYCTLIPV